MPFVHIQITREGVTAEQKAALIRGATDLLVQVLHKNPATTFVIVDEVDTDNWGVGGDSVTVLRRKAVAGASGEDPRLGEVRALMQAYFDGLYHSDADGLRRVFHPMATYASPSDEPQLVLGLGDYLARVAQRPSPASMREPRHDRILSIEFSGPALAVVRAQCAIAPRHYTDHLTLIRDPGGWRILCKAFHFEVREASPA